jgi:putative ABC transport system ATP-binding protein
MTSLLFETQLLCKHYHAGSRSEVRALQDVSVRVERGSLTLLKGPSGSGKTTLLALLGALDRPTQGRVLFQGLNLGDLSDAARARVRRRMGFVFQDFSLIPNLTAEENIIYPLIPRGMARQERNRRASQLLSRFGLAGRLATPARELSGGEQQRVAVARALAGDPEVVLADEPTSNLDPETSHALLTVFQEMHKNGVTIIASCHDPQLNSWATSVLELKSGNLMRQASGISCS